MNRAKTRSKYVYVASRPDGAHKIGISFNPDGRAYQLSVKMGCEVAIVHKRLREHDARNVERGAHGFLQEHHLGEEWFNVSASKAIAAVRKAAKYADEGKPLFGLPVSPKYYSYGPRMTFERVFMEFEEQYGADVLAVVVKDFNDYYASGGTGLVPPNARSAEEIRRELDAGLHSL